jgi:hypothetical protein
LTLGLFARERERETEREREREREREKERERERERETAYMFGCASSLTAGSGEHDGKWDTDLQRARTISSFVNMYRITDDDWDRCVCVCVFGAHTSCIDSASSLR